MTLITSCWPRAMSPPQPLDRDTEGDNNTHSKQTVTKPVLSSFFLTAKWQNNQIWIQFLVIQFALSLFLCSLTICHFVTNPPTTHTHTLTHHHHLLLPHIHTQLLAFNVQVYFASYKGNCNTNWSRSYRKDKIPNQKTFWIDVFRTVSPQQDGFTVYGLLKCECKMQ